MEFPVVELKVQKYSTSSHEKKKEGKWVTKNYLMVAEHWTKTLESTSHEQMWLRLF